MKAGNLNTADFSLQGVFHGQIYSLNNFSFSPDATLLTLNYTGLPDDNFNLTLVAGSFAGSGRRRAGTTGRRSGPRRRPAALPR